MNHTIAGGQHRNKVLYLLLFIIAINHPHAQAQSDKVTGVRIKGKIVHGKTSGLRLYASSFFYDKMDDIPVKDNGQFDVFIKSKYEAQVGVFFDTSLIMINVVPGDIIHIDYDLTKDSLIRIYGQMPQISARLRYDASSEVASQRRRQLMFMRMSKDNLSDSIKYAICAQYYSMELDSLIQGKRIFGNQLDKYINDLYFSYINSMDGVGLKDYEKLVSLTVNSSYKGVPEADHYKIMSRNLLLKSPQYRSWIFSETRETPREDLNYLHIKYADAQKSFPWIEFYKASAINDPFIRDWYATTSIIFSFQNYNFGEARIIMDSFLVHCQSPMFKKALRDYWISNLKFKAGSPAPAIALRNYKGEKVFLKDFKGKVVYMDFWGVHCGACLNEMEHYLPQMELTFKNRDIVFLNICVEGDKSDQEKIMSNFGLKGINTTCTLQAASDAYNITGIPHYVIIDKQGNILDYHARTPSEIIAGPQSLMDVVQ